MGEGAEKFLPAKIEGHDLKNVSFELKIDTWGTKAFLDNLNGGAEFFQEFFSKAGNQGLFLTVIWGKGLFSSGGAGLF